jgi:predicted transcriptional regulator
MNRDIIAKYEIKRLRPPTRDELLEDVEWLCKSLGFLSERDKDKTAIKIFEKLLERAHNQMGVTSDELAELVGITRGAVVHHLNKMIRCGLVLRRSRYYELRTDSLQMTLDEIESDIHRIMENIRKIAKSIDERLGLKYRRM